MIGGFTIAAAMAVASPQAAVPVPLADAVALWQRLCVDTMPTAQRFVDAFNRDTGNGWQKFKPKDHPVSGGTYWRSPKGILTYVSAPFLPATINDPGCHYTFAVEPGYSHADGVTALRAALGLDAGASIGNAKAPQHRWESDRPNGMHFRIFLSASDDLGVPGARLSVSLRRAPQ
ncbi:MAG: hypothetical protein ACAH11_07140 [Sphingomonas sp.]